MLNLLRNFILGIGIMAVAIIAFVSGGCSNTNAVSTSKIAYTPVTECGTIISTPGDYVLTQSLTSTSNSVDCIQIASPGVRLELASNISLSGPGGTAVTAAGINILQSAYGIQLEIEGATIQGFGVGINVQGSGVAISGGVTGGTVTKNEAQGILISHANGVLINTVASQVNGGAGIELWNASGVIVQGIVTVQGNEGYGLWVRSSSGNQVFNIDAFTNKLAGVYVGEVTGDTVTSLNNVFVNGGSVQNGGAGFEIGAGDSNNVVTATGAQANTGMDAVDLNSGCDHNTWVGNSFTTTNANCIH
jgi:hypothetical protein